MCFVTMAHYNRDEISRQGEETEGPNVQLQVCFALFFFYEDKC